jgi:fatty-acyl-CoA synthase
MRGADLGSILARAAARFGDRPAVVLESHTVTYGELDARVTRLADALRQRGVKTGDRVALLMENRTEYVEALFALARAGLVSVPISWHSRPADVKRVIDDCAATYLISEAKFRHLSNAGLSSRHLRGHIVIGDPYASDDHTPVPTEGYEQVIASGSESFVFVVIDDDDTQSIY